MIRTALFGLAALAAATGANAVSVRDSAGDFLPTYTGPQGGDLDVLTARAVFDGTNFTLSSTQAGAVGTTPGGVYVWGINRGAGTEGLTLGAPPVGSGVFFDAVAVLFPDGTGTVVTFPLAGAPTATPLIGAVTVLGNSIAGLIPLALLPSRGFTAADYTFNLWPRNGLGSNVQISDFAPDASNFAASVPEPASWALLIAGFSLTGAAMRRRVNLQRMT